MSNPTSPSDEDLQAIRELKRGNIHGLEGLVRGYQTRALRTSYLITRDRQLAEDVVQNSFLRAYERIDQFESDRPFGPWFLRIVVNASLKAATRAMRSVSYDTEFQSSCDLLLSRFTHEGPETELERDETRREVREALAALSPRQRASVVLRYYLDFTEVDIAIELAVPVGTVKRRLHDARKRLRSLLRNEPIIRDLQAKEG